MQVGPAPQAGDARAHHGGRGDAHAACARRVCMHACACTRASDAAKKVQQAVLTDACRYARPAHLRRVRRARASKRERRIWA
eukprot:6195606-Pleurochrysis_carterae.AAC.1